MPIETLTYETPQFLQKLLGHDMASLRILSEAFDVQVTSREGWIRLEGDEAGVSGARMVLAQLEKVRRQGGEITPAMIRLVAESVLAESGEAPAASTSSDVNSKVAAIAATGNSRVTPIEGAGFGSSRMMMPSNGLR